MPTTDKLNACEKELKKLRSRISELEQSNTKLEERLEKANKSWKHPERLGSSEERSGSGSSGGSKRSSKRNTRKRKSQNKSRNKNH